ncbi:MAG: response regulator, partial [SAR324 cluster bacterium]|nr:response regulator [SAR324 cluster bacterium]
MLKKETDMIARISKSLTALIEGDLSSKRLPAELGEFEETFSLLSQVTTSLKEISAQANQIAGGDYSADIKPRSNKDELGIAMQKMTTNLRDMVEENKKQNWIKTGQNEINKKARGDQDENTLARNIITYLAKYLGAQIGALYLKEESSEDLKLMGSYAFSKRKHLNERIQIGEGLVGQAAFEKEIISVTNIPADYTRIGSAIGDAVPRNVVVSPFMVDEQLNGIIELGSFKEFSDKEMELLNSISEGLAISFNRVRGKVKMQELLEKARNQAEELEVQSEELRTTNEELEEKSKSMEVQQEELRATNEELEEKSESLAAQSEEPRLANDNLEMQKSEIEKKSKELEIKAEEVAISSRYKSEFLANMSHELRTPLNSMLLLSKSLAKNKKGNMTPEQVQSATIVHQGGKDLLVLINDILDLSKIEAGMMEVELMRFTLQELVENLERNFNHMLAEKGLDFIIKTDPNLPGSIRSDQKRLGQILKNFMSNAIKFTKEGSITVDFSRPTADVNLSKSGLDHSKTLSIAVTDTGIGIPEDNQKLLFEAFQQAEGGTARKYGGTGLGLSISRELAALLGGEVQLQSQADKGSTFTLYIPLDGKRVEAQRKRKEAQRQAEGTKAQRHEGVEAQGQEEGAEESVIQQSESSIAPLDYHVEDDREVILSQGCGIDGPRPDDKKIMLLIEDDPKFAQILVNQSHDHGFMCVATSTGEEGLTLAGQYLPDAIVLDLHLPGVDGWYVLNALKDNQKTRHIPVHIMSADNEKQDAESRGAIGFISKPVNQEQLDGAFQNFLKYTEKAVKDLLVIEDDEATRLAIKEVIGNGDVKITEVRTGAEGFQTLISGNFDCVILDLNLSDISGLEVLEKLVLEKNFRIPPVIIYTGSDLSKEEHQQLIKYAETVIIKGVDSEDRLLDETS